MVSKETDEDEVDLDELQIIDALVKEEEEKEGQPSIVTNMDVQIDDLTKRQPFVTIDFAVQPDDLEGEPQVRISLQVAEPDVNQLVKRAKNTSKTIIT